MELVREHITKRHGLRVVFVPWFDRQKDGWQRKLTSNRNKMKNYYFFNVEAHLFILMDDQRDKMLKYILSASDLTDQREYERKEEAVMRERDKERESLS